MLIAATMEGIVVLIFKLRNGELKGDSFCWTKRESATALQSILSFIHYQKREGIATHTKHTHRMIQPLRFFSHTHTNIYWHSWMHWGEEEKALNTMMMTQACSCFCLWVWPWSPWSCRRHHSLTLRHLIASWCLLLMTWTRYPHWCWSRQMSRRTEYQTREPGQLRLHGIQPTHKLSFSHKRDFQKQTNAPAFVRDQTCFPPKFCWRWPLHESIFDWPIVGCCRTFSGPWCRTLAIFLVLFDNTSSWWF